MNSEQTIAIWRQLRLRAIPVKETLPDGVEGFALVPARDSLVNTLDAPEWEGSYVPLLCSAERGHILVSYGSEAVWQGNVADVLTQILGIPIIARGD